MVHDPIVDRKLAYHYQVTMHIHAHAGLIVRYWSRPVGWSGDGGVRETMRVEP